MTDYTNTYAFAETTGVDEGKQDAIVAGIKETGIPLGIYYPKCFHEQPIFEHLGYKYGDFPKSEKASREVLSLPMHPFMEKDQSYIVTENVLSIV